MLSSISLIPQRASVLLYCVLSPCYSFVCIIMPADTELNSVLSRRCMINDQLDAGIAVPKRMIKFCPADFSEFSLQQIREYERIFKQ